MPFFPNCVPIQILPHTESVCRVIVYIVNITVYLRICSTCIYHRHNIKVDYQTNSAHINIPHLSYKYSCTPVSMQVSIFVKLVVLWGFCPRAFCPPWILDMGLFSVGALVRGAFVRRAFVRGAFVRTSLNVYNPIHPSKCERIFALPYFYSVWHCIRKVIPLPRIMHRISVTGRIYYKHQE